MPEEDRAARIAQALSDPLRLAVLRFLADQPAAVSELAALTGAGQPNLSNHLAVLRRLGLVRSRRRGRQAIYRVAGPEVVRLVTSLLTLAGSPAGRPAPTSPLTTARTCYGHLAGRLGVALFDRLAERGALERPVAERAEVAVLPPAGQILQPLGVRLPDPPKSRRRYAFACRDWTERRFHLGGVVGAAIAESFLAAGWIRRDEGSRLVEVTPAGDEVLRWHLGLDLLSAPAAHDSC